MSKLIQTVLATRAGYGLTVLRVFIGIIFAAHGSQKLFGWFGGGGLAGTAQWMESIGLAPGTLMALLAQSASVQEWNHHKAAVSARDLLEHFDHLSSFKSF